MSTLKEYLTKKEMSFRAFGRKADIDPAQLIRYTSGANLPSITSAYKIYKASEKTVGLVDWFKKQPKKKDKNVSF